MINKKVLILNGSYSEIPLIKSLQELGYYVITLGTNDDGLGHRVADKHIHCDYSDREAVLKVAKKENIDKVVSSCHDFALLTTAWVSEQLCLKGHDSLSTSEIIHIKDKYRKFATEIGIKTPKICTCKSENDIEQISENLKFPIMIKAVDLTTGHGMTKCNTKEELSSALQLALSKTRQDYVLAEEFIEGTNHGFTTLIQNQKVVFHFVDIEQHNINKYLVSGAATTTKVSQSAINQLIVDCNKIAKELNLVDGILHIQFILDSNNEPTILEITRRAPGDLYIKFVEFATGINYPELIVKAEMGLPMGEVKQENIKYNIVRHCIMSENEGVIKDVIIDQSIADKIKHSMYFWKKGDLIKDHKLYKAGIVFIYFDSEEEMENTIPKLNSLITIVTT